MSTTQYERVENGSVSLDPSPLADTADQIEFLLGEARTARMFGEFAVALDKLHRAIALAESSPSGRDVLKGNGKTYRFGAGAYKRP